MWSRIEPERLILGKTYDVMDSQRFTVKAVFDGECFKNAVTKEVITNPVRIWE